jgi:hypothetical protein
MISTLIPKESMHGGHVPGRNSSIPVITHARASPFLGKGQEHTGA